MRPLLNASKGWQTIPAGYLKKRKPSKKHTKKQIKFSNRNSQTQTLQWNQEDETTS